MQNFLENLTSGDKEHIEQALLQMASLNVQIYPSKIRVELNDKDTKVTFGLTEELIDYAADTGRRINIVEKHNYKKRSDIKTHLRLYSGKNFKITEPLTQFDRAVFSVCISEQVAGNFYTTPAIINRGLTGKIGKHDAKTFKNQRAAIMHSLQKLMGTIVEVDLTDYCKTFEVKVDKSPVFVGQVLPAQYVEAAVNGNDATVIHFPEAPQDRSPLWKAADLKNQILRYDVTLLNVPAQNNTPRIIAVKNYILCRVAEIKAHTQLPPTITFQKIFEKCGLTDARRNVKADARNAIFDLVSHLKTCKFIKDFEPIQQRNLFYGVKLTF